MSHTDLPDPARPKEQITTDPNRASERMRAGRMTLTFAPWIIAAVLLALLPSIFTSKPALPIMNQMWITVVFAMAYQMLPGTGGVPSF